jgi:hypothetical protein
VDKKWINCKSMWKKNFLLKSYPHVFHMVIHKKLKVFHKMGASYPHVDKMWITLLKYVDNFKGVCG